jgi:TolA-binding protein
MPETAPLLREDVDRLRADLLRVDQTIQRLQAEVKAELQRADRQTAQTLTEIQRSLAQIGARFDELGRDTGQIQGRLDELRRRLDAVMLQLDVAGLPPPSPAGTRGPASPAPPGPAAPLPGGMPAATPDRQGTARDATDLYQTAYVDYTRGHYALAIAAFREVILRYPGTDLAEKAQYWIGESHFSLGRSLVSRGEPEQAVPEFERAVQELRRILIDHPKSDLAPSALLKRALALLELKQPALAEADLRMLAEQYPEREEAAKAREELARLRR